MKNFNQQDDEDDVLRRLVRIETRLIKLMQHLGLTADGKPANKPVSTQRRTHHEHDYD